jgi:hypothetical protein
MILKVQNTENYKAADGLWVWNGKGWDNKISQADLLKPRLMIKNGEILWLDLPEAEAEAKKDVKKIKEVKDNAQ